MSQSKLSELSVEKLIKRRDLLKGASIGLGIVYILAVTLIIYFITANGFKEIPFAALIPVFALPVTFTPLIANISLLNKEIKSRNTKEF